MRAEQAFMRAEQAFMRAEQDRRADRDPNTPGTNRPALWWSWCRFGTARIRNGVTLGLGSACASDLRQEPRAVVPLVGICAGGTGRPVSLPRHR